MFRIDLRRVILCLCRPVRRLRCVPEPDRALGRIAALGLAIAVLLTVGLEAADAPPLNRHMAAIAQREVDEQCSVSVQVVDLETGLVLMDRNPHLPLVPASTLKLVTSAAALSVLKPDFTFSTEVFADDVRGFSVGNLFLRGTGDPYLVNEELFVLTRALRDRGLQEIRGNIVVDESYFIPSQPLDENEKLGHRAYHAPYSALSLNFNAVKILVVPGSRVGQAAQISLDPLSEYATVKGQVSTVKGDQAAQLTIKKETTPQDREIIVVDGRIGKAAEVKGRYVNVASPGLYAGEVFKEFLLREGVKAVGRVVTGTTPASAQPYYEHSSRPLGIVAYGLNKFSNNFMAEQLCMALGAKVHGAPGTREKGLSVIRRHLLSCGVPEGEFTLSEASGLSRNNRLSAAALVQVLLAASKDFSYGPEFIASLGVAGVDGTLKEKFAEKDTRRRLRAKTGTLRGVNALAGYGLSPDNKRFAFAVIVNSHQKGVGIIDHADRIARQILEIPMGKKQ